MELPMASPFVHVELATNDVEKPKTFYRKLFDWKMEDIPMGWGTYTMIDVGEAPAAGL
jgi:predicted enzyme related to lactoylglutathione lyase